MASIENTMYIDLQIEHWAIERLIPRATNPRTHSRGQIANIAASIREWGWTNPILVGADDDIIAGYARLAAARKLGMKEVPVIVLSHLSPAQRRALVIADNQLAIAGAGWDEEMLRIELAVLHEEDYNLDLVGFDDLELQRLLEAQDVAAGLADEDVVPEVQSDPVAKPGDVFVLGASNAVYAAGFGGSTRIFGLQDLPNTRRVALSGGCTGMFRAVSCGGSCAPANLWWEQNGVMNQIQMKLGSGPPEKGQEKILVETVNSMVPARRE